MGNIKGIPRTGCYSFILFYFFFKKKEAYNNPVIDNSE